MYSQIPPTNQTPIKSPSVPHPTLHASSVGVAAARSASTSWCLKIWAVKSISYCSRRFEYSALDARLRVLIARNLGPELCLGVLRGQARRVNGVC